MFKIPAYQLARAGKSLVGIASTPNPCFDLPHTAQAFGRHALRVFTIIPKTFGKHFIIKRCRPCGGGRPGGSSIICFGRAAMGSATHFSTSSLPNSRVNSSIASATALFCDCSAEGDQDRTSKHDFHRPMHEPLHGRPDTKILCQDPRHRHVAQPSVLPAEMA